MSYRGAGTVKGPLHFEATGSPGVAPVTEGRIYFDSGTNTFMVSESGGSYASIVTSAAFNLQGSYNGGQAITEAAIGGTITQTPISITNAVATNTDVLQLVKSPVGPQSGNGLTVSMNASTTADGISVTHSGTSGAAARFSRSGSSA